MGTSGQDVSTAGSLADDARAAATAELEDARSSRSERGTNRRLTARTTCHLTVRYRVGGTWHPATAMDLSKYGCRLRVGEDLERTAPVHISFETIGSGAPPVEVDGRVIWSRLEGLSHQVGVHFGDVPSELDRILRG